MSEKWPLPSSPPWRMGAPPLRAVIFDLDGTLIDTLEDIADSMNDALRALGMRSWPLASYRTFVGDGAQILAARVLPQPLRDAVTIESVYQHYLAAYSRRWALKSRPYDGIEELLASCQSAGLRLAVLSNKAHHFTVQVVDRFLPHAGWEIVLGQQSGVARKPSPDGALRIANRLGAQPSECLFLGDSDVDMLCARAAGMWALGALWGFRPAAEITAAGAHALASDPREAARLIHA